MSMWFSLEPIDDYWSSSLPWYKPQRPHSESLSTLYGHFPISFGAKHPLFFL